MKSIPLNECHKLLIEMASEFHRLCILHDIPYYMLGGTQLGAVRHNGFIPWDDDMDFGVPRDAYNNLKKILLEELKYPYKLISVEFSPSFNGGFMKIEDTRTLMKEKGNEGVKYGINIDIFPLDITNNHIGFFSKNNMIDLLYKIENYRFGIFSNLSLFKKTISISLKILLPFLDKTTIYKFIERYLLVKKGDYIANHYGAWGLKEISSIKTFGTPRLYNFENKQFYGVEKEDIYLKELYGDYMKLPPENKRHSHIEEIVYK